MGVDYGILAREERFRMEIKLTKPLVAFMSSRYLREHLLLEQTPLLFLDHRLLSLLLQRLSKVNTCCHQFFISLDQIAKKPQQTEVNIPHTSL